MSITPPTMIPGYCARCRLSIFPGQESLVCPDCGGVHHTLCWQSAAGCSVAECPSQSAGTLDLPAANTPISSPSNDDHPTTSEVNLELSEDSKPAVLKINDFDLDRAIPLRVIKPRFDEDGNEIYDNEAARRKHRDSGTRRPRPNKKGKSEYPTSRLAVASFIIALISLTPLGLLTGLLAIILGLVAVGNIRANRQRGIGWAASGVGIGATAVILWVGVIVWYVGPQHGGEMNQPVVDDTVIDERVLEDLEPILQRAMYANVLIEMRGKGLFDGGGLGSGIILQIQDKTAYILTNRHVIDPDYSERTNTSVAPAAIRSELQIKLVGQHKERGVVLWTAPDGVDLAIVTTTVSSTKAQATLWEKGINPKIGADVFAVGNPHGLGWTQTKGIVSQMRVQPKGAREVRLIQTSAAINAGNSGGGLYDTQGHLVGINTSTIEKNAGEGLSFAISFETFLEFEVPFLSQPGALPRGNAP